MDRLDGAERQQGHRSSRKYLRISPRPSLASGNFVFELLVDRADLPGSCVERSGVVDYEVGGGDLPFVRPLRCHTAGHLLAGGFRIEFEPGGKALDSLVVAAGDDDKPLKLFLGAGFEKERCLHELYGFA